jgi:membrane protease YdiL (CAAX protease family)
LGTVFTFFVQFGPLYKEAENDSFRISFAVATGLVGSGISIFRSATVFWLKHQRKKLNLTRRAKNIFCVGLLFSIVSFIIVIPIILLKHVNGLVTIPSLFAYSWGTLLSFIDKYIEEPKIENNKISL